MSKRKPAHEVALVAIGETVKAIKEYEGEDSFKIYAWRKELLVMLKILKEMIIPETKVGSGFNGHIARRSTWPVFFT